MVKEMLVRAMMQKWLVDGCEASLGALLDFVQDEFPEFESLARDQRESVLRDWRADKAFVSSWAEWNLVGDSIGE